MRSAHLRSFVVPADFRVLYLAKHVFDYLDDSPATSGQYPRYHREVADVLRALEIEVEVASDVSALFEQGSHVDYVFSLLNRVPIRNGEVFVSAICEYLKKPYLGGSPAVRAVAEDKHVSKHLAASLKIPTSPWFVLNSETSLEQGALFPGPYFVKPRTGAASEHVHDMSFQVTWSGAIARAQHLLSLGIDAIIERFVEGENITVPVLGNDAPMVLPPVILESANPKRILTYEEKLQNSGDLEFSELHDQAAIGRLVQYAKRIHTALAPVDYTRIDFRYNRTVGEMSFLELNVCCDISSFGSFMYSANTLGLTQHNVISHILSYSFGRQYGLR